MMISFGKNFSLKRMGLAWMRHWGLFFFSLFFLVFCFGVFKWYTMVYAPQDRVELEKKKILESESEKLDMERFENVVKSIEDRDSLLGKEYTEKDIFYP